MAQVPNGFNYQAVARDGNGNVLANKNITIIFNITNGQGGTSYYAENHKVTTNAQGLFNLVIGQGTTSNDNFNTIPWSQNDNIWLKVEIKSSLYNGILGETKFWSMPYAKYAESAGKPLTAGNGISIDNNVITNTKPNTDNQTLSIHGDTLFISGGNYVIIPGMSCLKPCDTIHQDTNIWFKTDQSNFNQVNIKIQGGNGNYSVNWGDGSPIEHYTFNGTLQELNHSYSGSAVYLITISGAVDKIHSIFNFSNNIIEANISAAVLLVNLNLSDNPALSSLNLNDNLALTQLVIESCNFTEIDLSKNLELEILLIRLNNFSEININNNNKLIQLSCMQNKLTNLDVSNNPQLVYLFCQENELSSLDVTNNTKLQILVFHINNISTIDLSQNQNLTSLGFLKNDINMIDLSNQSNLNSFIANSNQLENIDFSNNTQLNFINLKDNRIVTANIDNILGVILANVQANPMSGYLYIAGNELPSIIGINIINTLRDDYSWIIDQN